MAQKNNTKKWFIAGGILVLLIGGTFIGRHFAGQGVNSDKVTTLKIAHTQNYAPYDYVDDKGKQQKLIKDNENK